MKKTILLISGIISITTIAVHAQISSGSGGVISANSPSTNLNVGIGTTDPKHKLHIHDGGILISGTTAGFGGPQLIFSDDISVGAHPNGRWSIEYLSAAATRLSMSGLNFWSPWNPGVPPGAGNYSLFLKDDGKIGMGVTDDNTDLNFCSNALPGGYRLYVNGGILTTKVKVALYCSNDWADYVFAPGYKLQPLSELESFVKENKHLPNVPSAEELVNEGGIDMNAMFAKQMAKIEELTLYIIEQNKRIEQLEKKINEKK